MAAYNNFQSGYSYPMYSAANYQAYAPTQPQYAQQGNNGCQQQAQNAGIIWVDGEVGAKAYQLPQGWPANAPMPLWDTNDTIIYLKSVNQMGMPNPLQKVHYTMDEPQRSPMMSNANQQAVLPASEHRMPDMSAYVTKDDLERMKEELKTALAAGTDAKGARTNVKSSV